MALKFSLLASILKRYFFAETLSLVSEFCSLSASKVVHYPAFISGHWTSIQVNSVVFFVLLFLSYRISKPLVDARDRVSTREPVHTAAHEESGQ